MSKKGMSKNDTKNELEDFLCSEIKKINEINENETPPPPSGPFDFLNDLSEKKGDLFQKYMDYYGVEPSIPWYIIDKGFGNHKDTVWLANIMNEHYNVPNRAKYIFYDISIPKKRRYGSWDKKGTSDETKILSLCNYFGWGREEARQNLVAFETIYSQEDQERILNSEKQEKMTKRI